MDNQNLNTKPEIYAYSKNRIEQKPTEKPSEKKPKKPKKEIKQVLFGVLKTFLSVLPAICNLFLIFLGFIVQVTVPVLHVSIIILIIPASFFILKRLRKEKIRAVSAGILAVDMLLIACFFYVFPFRFQKTENGTYAIVETRTVWQSMTIPSNIFGTPVTEIRGFATIDKLENLTIPEGVTVIAQDAFSNCDGLTSVKLPSTVTEIGSYAFSDCDALTTLEIPLGVTQIGYGAFSGSALTETELPEGVTRIEKYTFSGCSDLADVTIPQSVTDIGANAFAGCHSLTKIQYSGTQSQWEAIEKNDGWNDNAPIREIICSDGVISLQ